MRFALIIYGTLDTLSGGYLYDRKMVAHLRDRGHEVDIISLPWRGYGRHLTDNFDFTLARRLHDGAYAAIIQDELNHPSLVWLNGALRRFTPTPIISLVHHLRSREQHPPALRRLYRRIERRYLSTVDGFIFNSQTTRRTVEELVGRKPHVVATPGGDRWAEEPFSAVEDRPAPPPLRLLFIGNLIRRKGLHTLATAVARMPSSSVALTVVGDATVEPHYARQVLSQLAALPHPVNITGRLAAPVLEAELRQAHLLVVPSSYEGFGIVYLEAHAFGVPAIGTSAGAAGEIIRHGDTGFLVSPDDASALHHTLRWLLENPRDLKRLARQARLRYNSFPTWQQSMTRIEAFLVDIAARPVRQLART
jgi:glycosyltransferase involved in cell wall biosynthesis